MSKWNETGILRKKQVKDNFDDLLVFGYACKLFRDDEKALYIDQGKHLIPWMGDEKLKIDRYDGRGALSDLSRCEASKEGFDAMRWLGLNESDRRIEQLCDEERYYSLHTNEEEEALYKEEELKRKQTNEFSYSYDVPQDPEKENSQDSIPTCEEEVKVYVPPPELDVPADIDIPRTVKENARIEKTALFVSQQGPQMEILIKAKQADNPQFNFMNQNDSLYKYYRHVLAAIKGGRYKTHSQQERCEEKKDDVVEEDYLHPSLAPGQAAPPSASAPMRLPQIPYKPTADCAYTQLVTRIQGAVQSNDQTPPEEPPPTTTPTNPDQQQQYYQYYYFMQYYEYYKQIAQQYATQAGCDAQTILQNPQLQERIQTQASHYAQVACNQYIQNANNPYSQVPTTEPPAVPLPAKEEIKPVEVVAAAPPPATNPLQALVHYSSDSEDESEEDVKVTFTVPPQDTVAIIDKMANYVSKNGIEFESIVKVKKDPRFDFLEESHVYHKYYRHKVEEYKREVGIQAPEPKVKEKKVIAPVSFSIKKPKEESPKEIKSALPVESDEETPCEGAATPPGPPPAPPTTVVEPPQPREAEAAANPTTSDNKPQEPPESAAQEVKNVKSLMEADDPILEMIDLTDDLEERRDAKRAEDKIKDKLAMVAKERLASKSKDRALQMERRKRAAMFLKLKSVEGTSAEETRTFSRVEEDVGEKKEEVLKIDDSESEEGEIRREKRSSTRRKKSHKRRSSRSRRHDSKSHRKRSKKRRRRSSSRSSSSTS